MKKEARVGHKFGMPDDIMIDLVGKLDWVNGKPLWSEPIRGSGGKGSEAGHIGRYRYIAFRGYRIAAHQISYWYEHGYIPKCIDHIDHDTDNNDQSNLRDGSGSVNSYNTSNRHWNYRDGRGYTSTITIKGKVNRSPRFESDIDAMSWYYSMAEYLGIGHLVY